MKQYTENLIAIRETKGWTRYRLAKESGHPVGSVQFWEAEKYAISLDNYIALCEAMEITPALALEWHNLDEKKQKNILEESKMKTDRKEIIRKAIKKALKWAHDPNGVMWQEGIDAFDEWADDSKSAENEIEKEWDEIENPSDMENVAGYIFHKFYE